MSGEGVDILPGNCLKLKSIPLGTTVHNVELKPGKGGQIARSAGSSVQLVAREGDYASLRMPSGELRLISVECLATVGQVVESAYGGPDANCHVSDLISGGDGDHSPQQRADYRGSKSPKDGSYEVLFHA